MCSRSLLSAAHLLCVCAVALAAPRSRFLVTAPGIIRPGANMTIGVDLLENSPPQVLVKAQVFKIAFNRSKSRSILEAEGIFNRGHFRTLILPALPLNSADKIYELHISGHSESGVLFSNKTRLTFESKRISVLIQTDKALYKPKQNVKFRVLTLFSDLKPYRTAVDIFIKDPKSNVIQQWFSQEGDLGVVSKTFQLSSHPILGDWYIQVQVNGQQYYQSFQVLEYVLPKFEVTLQTPLYCSLKSKHLNGSVTAKYTFGKPVKGSLSVTFLPLSLWGKQKNITKHFEINGFANFSFEADEMKNVLNLKKIMDVSEGNYEYVDQSFPGPVEIVATVTESLTGNSRRASANVFFKQHDYIIEIFDYTAVLKPTLNFTASVKVSRSDGNQLTPEEIENNLVTVVTQRKNSGPGSQRDQEMDYIQIINYTVPQNGIVKVEFPVTSISSELQLKASFLDSSGSVTVHSKFTSPSKTYIQLKTRDEYITVGSPFNLMVSSNKEFKDLSYMVISKGELVVADKKSSRNFSLTPEASWAPKAYIIAYYITEDEEIVNDILKIPVQLAFQNKVKLFWSKPRVKPSDKVSLRVSTTHLDSLVGIVAVDKSVTLMENPNDITMENMVHELELYNTEYYLGMFMNSFAVFQECGLWVLTDAILIRDNIDEVYDAEDYAERFSEENEANLVDFEDTSSVSKAHVRKHFPETWIWLDAYMGSKTHEEFEVTVPDSITTWVASAFVISEDLGFGLTSSPAELQAFQPFFISLNLPYSVIRGEAFALEVSIVNYLKDTTKVVVLIEESDRFEILMSSRDVNNTVYRKTALVPRENGVTLVFPIKPKHLGEIPITVTAASATASDAVTQIVVVKPEGIEKSYSQSFLLDLTDNNVKTDQASFRFSFPPDTVAGSERVQITAIGDILGSSIDGLSSLIRMPYGCGEQNMIQFAPSIYILDYLTKQKQLTVYLKEKALSSMRQGYQRELLYQREDGSFSAFGDRDSSGSTWLSAFVLRCFLEADNYIDIDQDVLHKIYTWLNAHKKFNGEYWEPGRVIHSELQGGNRNPVTLTAYIVTSVLGYKKYQPNTDVQDSIKFLESEFSRGISDNYTLAVVTYALSMVGSLKAEEALNTLMLRAEKEGDTQFWLSSEPTLPESWQSCSVDIEIAAYALLSHTLHHVSEGIPIMRWLIRQRNNLGGFVSTQDTVVALKALSEFSARVYKENTDLRLTVTGRNVLRPTHFQIDSRNLFLLHKEELAALDPIAVNISAHGFGFAICQLSVDYNVKGSGSSKRRRSTKDPEFFDLDVAVSNKDDISHLNLNVCTSHLGPKRTGMVLLEVNLLSGFTVPSDSIPLSETLKKVEYDQGKVNLYLDSVNQTQFCVNVPTVRDYKVSNIQGGSVSIMDYYEPRRQAVRSYNTRAKLSSCYLSADENCNWYMDGAADSLRHSSSLLVFCSILLYFVQH
ncbi:CD109 antigen [Mastomys coucha]|uniref:CD109 antigen n=1 Tax=Mastomys coucha TaxID=35658 RepID=UPI001261A337|nr:CD109 antigen [Mastomys coucha]